MKDKKQTIIIYIAGYGRSGSTLVSILLDNLPNVISVGEVAALPFYYGKDGLGCSCSEGYEECPLWGRVIGQLPGGVDFVKEMGEYQKRIEPWYTKLLKGYDKYDLSEYKKYMTKFFETIHNETENRIIVDSSKSSYKTTWRALALSTIDNVKLILVHLIRDLKSVVSSCKKGRNVNLVKGGRRRSHLRASMSAFTGWVTANMAARYTHQQLESKHSIVTEYKDLVRSTEKELKKIMRIVHNNNHKKVGKKHYPKNNLRVGHMVGSNRMAKNNQIITIDRSKDGYEQVNFFEHWVANIIRKIEVTK